MTAFSRPTLVGRCFVALLSLSATASLGQFVGRPDQNDELENGSSSVASTLPPQGSGASQNMYCVGPLVPSSHRNPMSELREELSGCALSCSSGAQTYGLSAEHQ